ncbi:MAG: (Fe-S)-binding protein [Heliobacteriaceae bacterium]|nr:(Fe-S)-binding protein [Heliobacteriaceae bacterium]MDD4588384.1 (Fe-S)-binding protein [Heliobacteriaceae bacterium]
MPKKAPVTGRTAARVWLPPGKNCGLCGENSCRNFLRAVYATARVYADCPYYDDRELKAGPGEVTEAVYSGRDVLGHAYDFVLGPLPGEVSARKIVLPFRADLVEKLGIKEGDYVLGRPMGAGCPVPHVLQVIKAEPVTGLLYTWVVGPQFAREQAVKDVVAYHMIGFEGIAHQVSREPVFGCRVTFLPGFCMMALNHTGFVNLVLAKSCGIQVRLEDIRILAGPDQDV